MFYHALGLQCGCPTPDILVARFPELDAEQIAKAKAYYNVTLWGEQKQELLFFRLAQFLVRTLGGPVLEYDDFKLKIYTEPRQKPNIREVEKRLKEFFNAMRGSK